MSNQGPNPFKWRLFQPEIIRLCLRWYLRRSLSSRDLEEMMLERDLVQSGETSKREPFVAEQHPFK